MQGIVCENIFPKYLHVSVYVRILLLYSYCKNKYADYSVFFYSDIHLFFFQWVSFSV